MVNTDVKPDVRAPYTYPTLTIRKSNPGEGIYRTGNAEFYYTIKVVELSDHKVCMSSHYCPVSEPARRAEGVTALPTVFHEVISENGECFAFPQVIGKDPLVPKRWQRCERELFSTDLNIWICIVPGEGGDGFELESGYEPDVDVSMRRDFSQRLEVALKPHEILTDDHPMIMRLRRLYGDLALDDTVPTGWERIA